LKARARRPPIGRARRQAAGDTRQVTASWGAAHRRLRPAEPAKQARKLQWQGRINNVGRGGPERVADRGQQQIAGRPVPEIHIIGQSERARVAGPQHGCTSLPQHVET
jgi:hypothetical protein